MSEATRYPVADADDRAQERAERQAMRERIAGLVEIIDATGAMISGLDGAAIGTVRATLQDVLRRQREIARAVKSLARLAGGAAR